MRWNHRDTNRDPWLRSSGLSGCWEPILLPQMANRAVGSVPQLGAGDRLPRRQEKRYPAAAGQADEAHHLFPLEPEFCPGAIALTAGDPAHAHAVWNIDSVFPEPLQAVDKY